MNYRQPFVGDYPITQRFGEVITGVTYKNEPHTGIDYACPIGTEILASGEGTVIFAGWDKTGYGNMVAIRHPDMLSSFYAHLSEICVKAGQAVKQGDVIGKSGYSGNVVPAGAAGAHLHFEMRSITGKPFDPATVLRSVNDSVVVVKNATTTLKGTSSFHKGDTVQITAPFGAKAFFRGFSDRTTYPMGSRFYYTGQTQQHNGYTYMEVIPLQVPVWVAVNDGETQILDNAD